MVWCSGPRGSAAVALVNTSALSRSNGPIVGYRARGAVKGFSEARGNKFPKKSWCRPSIGGILSSRPYGCRLAACLPSNQRTFPSGGYMTARFEAGVLSVVLVATIGGLVCEVSAQGQTTTTKAVGSSLPASAVGGTSSTEGSSSSLKKGTAAADPDSSLRQDSKAPAPSKAKIDDSYVVGIADSLVINVWKEPDFSGPVVVRPDGMITVPVVGDIHVVGLTTTQVQDLLTEKLKGVVTEPQVTVIVRDIKSRKVYLVGKVGRPGAILLGGHETVLQVLAEAGGPMQFAKPQKMYVLRTVDDHQKRIQFNYKKVLAGTEPDLELVVGDVIVVP